MARSLGQLHKLLKETYIPVAPEARTVILENLRRKVVLGALAASRLVAEEKPAITRYEEIYEHLSQLLDEMNSVLRAYGPEGQ
jgi:hypothetical protein